MTALSLRHHLAGPQVLPTLRSLAKPSTLRAALWTTLGPLRAAKSRARPAALLLALFWTIPSPLLRRHPFASAALPQTVMQSFAQHLASARVVASLAKSLAQPISYPLALRPALSAIGPLAALAVLAVLATPVVILHLPALGAVTVALRPVANRRRLVALGAAVAVTHLRPRTSLPVAALFAIFFLFRLLAVPRSSLTLDDGAFALHPFALHALCGGSIPLGPPLVHPRLSGGRS